MQVNPETVREIIVVPLKVSNKQTPNQPPANFNSVSTSSQQFVDFE